MIDSTKILHYILKHCIDDPKLNVLSFSMKDSDYEKFRNHNESKDFSKQKVIILKILETLWIVPEHINFKVIGYENDSIFEECIAFFINGNFLNEDNELFYFVEKRDYITNILNTFYEEFPLNGLDKNDLNQMNRFIEFTNCQTLYDIKEFWTVFIKYQIVYFKYKKNGLGFDEWNNFGLNVYNDLIRGDLKKPILGKVNIVLSKILNPKEFHKLPNA